MIAWLIRTSAAILVLAVVAVTVLASCAPIEARGYRDVTGQGRDLAALRADEAQCRYEYAQARAGSSQFKYGDMPNDAFASALLSAPAPALYDACIEARGWEWVR